jgi:hypothetical protein
MEIKLNLQHRGYQLSYLIHPLSRTIYHACLVNGEQKGLTPFNNIKIYMTGMNWQSNCDDSILVKELSTVIKTILN